MIVGGYRNEGRLSAEHAKLPESLRRRVGASIRVVSATDERVVYVNHGRVHTFVPAADGWRWTRPTAADLAAAFPSTPKDPDHA